MATVLLVHHRHGRRLLLHCPADRFHIIIEKGWSIALEPEIETAEGRGLHSMGFAVALGLGTRGGPKWDFNAENLLRLTMQTLFCVDTTVSFQAVPIQVGAATPFNLHSAGSHVVAL